MSRGLVRFLLEAGFLVAVAVAAGFADLSPAEIVIVMAVAWVLVALVERVATRERSRGTRSLAAPVPALEPAVQTDTAPPDEPASAGAVRAEPPTSPIAREGVTAPRAEAVAAGPEPPAVGFEAPQAEEAEAASEAAPAPDAAPGPERPALELVAVAPPPIEAERVPVQAEAAEEAPAIEEPVVQPPRMRVPEQVVPVPSTEGVQWNVWDIERVARERAGHDAARDEERTFMLLYLREFADATGLLPPDFNALVRESFADLIASPK